MTYTMMSDLGSDPESASMTDKKSINKMKGVS